MHALAGWTRAAPAVSVRNPETLWWGAGAAYLGCQFAHLLTHEPLWAALAFLVVVTAVLAPALGRRRPGAWAAWAALLVFIAGATAAGRVVALMDTVAVLVNALVGWFFARTLRRGREPLLVRLVADMEGAAYLAQPGVRAYVSTLTRVWAAVMLAQALLLGLCWLALHAGVPLAAGAAAPWLEAYLRYGSYLIIVLLFALEYPWRVRWLPAVRQRPFPEMLRRTAASWRHLMHGPDA